MRKHNQKLHGLVTGLIVLNLLALILLSVIGVESMPFLVEALKSLVL